MSIPRVITWVQSVADDLVVLAAQLDAARQIQESPLGALEEQPLRFDPVAELKGPEITPQVLNGLSQELALQRLGLA